VRLLVAAGVVRFCMTRWQAFDASARLLEAYGFPAAHQWLGIALLAGGVGAVLLVSGWYARLGAVLVGAGFLPVGAAFSAVYTPGTETSAPGGLLVALVIGREVTRAAALLGLFLAGPGRYTAPHAAQRLVDWLRGRRADATAAASSASGDEPVRSAKAGDAPGAGRRSAPNLVRSEQPAALPAGERRLLRDGTGTRRADGATGATGPRLRVEDTG
jgi:uncharacterized membrane protein YphA (DoxX/SURF4 family)